MPNATSYVPSLPHIIAVLNTPETRVRKAIKQLNFKPTSFSFLKPISKNPSRIYLFNTKPTHLLSNIHLLPNVPILFSSPLSITQLNFFLPVFCLDGSINHNGIVNINTNISFPDLKDKLNSLIYDMPFHKSKADALFFAGKSKSIVPKSPQPKTLFSETLKLFSHFPNYLIEPSLVALVTALRKKDWQSFVLYAKENRLVTKRNFEFYLSLKNLVLDLFQNKLNGKTKLIQEQANQLLNRYKGYNLKLYMDTENNVTYGIRGKTKVQVS